jgi:hypothetical protein
MTSNKNTAPNDNKPVLRIKWTEEEIQFVIDKQKEGLSCGVIAKLMNKLGMRSDCAPVTRNAVVGVWDRHRSKLTKENELQTKTVLKKSHKKKDGPKSFVGSLFKPNHHVEQPKSFAGVIFEPSHHIEQRMNELKVSEVSNERMTMENVRDRCCKFPFNDPRTEDFFYCGEPIDYRLGRSYCTYHYKICYQAVERR